MEKQRPSITVSDRSFLLEANNSSTVNWQALFEQERQARIRLEEENNILRVRYQKLMEKKIGHHPLCAKCEVEKPQISKVALKAEYQNFSKQIERKLKDKRHSSEDLIESSAEEIEEEEVHDNTKIPFIENFAVLGIPDQQIAQFNQHESMGGVIWSMRKVTAIEEHAVHFAVPSGMNTKPIVGQKILEKIPKIMTNHSKQNIFLLIFKQQQGRFDKLNQESKRLIDLLNPGRKLFCLCIGTYDFTYIQKENQNEGDNSFSVHSFQLPTSKNNTSLNNSDVFPTFSSISQVSPNSTEIKVSQRIYCILSYFPFFSFFSNILISLLNLIKAERLEINQGRIEDIKKIDSRFQIKRLKKHFSKYLKSFNKQEVRLNMVYHLNLLNQSLLLQTDQNYILYSESEEWDYQVMSLFNLDTFIKVFTLFLLEDKLFFVCEQSKILTFTVYLISAYLSRPFKSVFEPVCIIPKEEQFLNAPFPSAYGVLKKKEWIKDKKILERFKNTYVFIEPSGVKIELTENRDDILGKKPKKLIKQLTPFFDRMKYRKESRQKLLNYDNQQTEYNWHSQREDRDIIIGILETTKRYLTLQVQKFIPSVQKLAEIKKSITKQMIPPNKDSHSFLIDRIILYIIEQRNSKDPFVQHLLRTQMLSQHISELLDLIVP